mmetsp:Transcript_35536/g.92626  ORF Transcript_35536/g.92626 Transcript_35536/m.92626 type:complete len:128 (+) Transcript_35536:1449-1832(+)
MKKTSILLQVCTSSLTTATRKSGIGGFEPAAQLKKRVLDCAPPFSPSPGQLRKGRTRRDQTGWSSRSTAMPSASSASLSISLSTEKGHSCMFALADSARPALLNHVGVCVCTRVLSWARRVAVVLRR